MKDQDQQGLSDASLDAEAIDAQFGLEPVFEPGRPDPVHPTEFVDVQCPHCGEHFDVEIDVSAGAFDDIEDCQVCCKPIAVVVELGESGEIANVTITRAG